MICSTLHGRTICTDCTSQLCYKTIQQDNLQLPVSNYHSSTLLRLTCAFYAGKRVNLTPTEQFVVLLIQPGYFNIHSKFGPLLGNNKYYNSEENTSTFTSKYSLKYTFRTVFDHFIAKCVTCFPIFISLQELYDIINKFTCNVRHCSLKPMSFHS